VHWARRAEVYITPVGPRLVGVAVLGPQRTDFDATIAGIPALAARLEGVEAASDLRGAGPFRQRASSPVSGRVLLVGDASGYVDAITGEGLRLGFDQARAAVACVVADRPADYARAWLEVTRDFRVLTSGLVRAASSPLRRGIVPTARALPWLYGSVVERLAR
jgi:flavin-dependent dehydrogenase